jgi:2-dehydropantoate 2-reductase
MTVMRSLSLAFVAPAPRAAAYRQPDGRDNGHPQQGPCYSRERICGSGEVVRMRLCVVGAGAIGGIIAVRLALAGEAVTVVVRDPVRRRAIAEDGFALLETSGERRLARDLRAVGTLAEAGPADVVILAVKAHQIAALVPDIGRILAPGTTVLTLQNGIPWWYFAGAGGPYGGRRLMTLDPEGTIAQAIPSECVVGGIAYVAGELTGPATVRHGGGNRLPLGELDGSTRARSATLSATLARAGFEAPVLGDIRAELWYKLWGNACFNPLGALTHATIGDICGYPPARALVLAMMEELSALAAALGIRFRETALERLAVSDRIARHRPSMAQDVEAGRALEADALASAIVELGALTGTPLPHVAAVHATLKLLDAVMATERLAFVRAPLGTRR